MREHRKIPKRLIRHKFRRNLEEFKTKEHTSATAYHRNKVNVSKLLEETQDDIQPQ